MTCAEEVRKKHPKLSLGAIVLPPASGFLQTLLRRNVRMFARDLHAIAAVAFVLPAWAGEVASRGWVTEKEAGEWLLAFMDGLRGELERIPVELRTDVERSMIELAKGEGRVPMR